MKRALVGVALGLVVSGAIAGCDGGQDGPQGLPTGPSLQTPVPNQPGDPAPTVIPMPPEEPGTMPPGDEGGPSTLIPTVQP